MNERLRAKMERAASLLNADGSVTPAADLPVRLLVPEGSGGVAADVQEALVAETVAHALKLARQQTHMSAKELAEKRHLTKGRLSQLENGSVNPTVGTLSEHANALGYDVTVVLTPRQEGSAIEVVLPATQTG
ncbi:helix-turn-helix domain-containing protein [Deinococcus sp.]|uniref:helix-turn-helix domain-containing protein n=1 Tax=Deinococcus sp. TaxID=47478 RepID=UPI003CC62D2D